MSNHATSLAFRKISSAILLTLGLLLMPAAIWLEGVNHRLWNDRLIIPQFEPEPDRHTPVHATGTILPPVISGQYHLATSDNPVLLTKTIRIAPGAHLTIEPGTRIFAHEFAQLIVEGSLTAVGSPARPITLSTNELHPLNQTWSGLTFAAGGQGQLTYVNIDHASPAISCLAGSQVTISKAHITTGTLGVFTTSEDCTIADSTITGVQRGVAAINTNFPLVNTVIASYKQALQTFDHK